MNQTYTPQSFALQKLIDKLEPHAEGDSANKEYAAFQAGIRFAIDTIKNAQAVSAL